MMFFRFLEEDFTIKEGEIKMKYVMIRGVVESEVEEEINDRLDRGWELYGNPFWDGSCYCQAMIKKS